MAVARIRYPFTVDDYHRMVAAGILTEDDRVELIEGDIVAMSPIGGLHANCVDVLTQLAVPLAGNGVRLRVQNAVRLSDDTEVQPDISIVRERVYGRDLPAAVDVLLLIEVADTTLASDRDVKIPLYARAGIPQTILIDVSNPQLWLYREPRQDGYRIVQRFSLGDELVVSLTPTLTVTIKVDDLFSF